MTAATARGARVDPTGLAGFRPAGTLLAARGRTLANGPRRGSAEQRFVAVVVALAAAGAGTLLARFAGVALDDSDPSPDSLASPVAGALGMLAGFTLVTAVPFTLGSLFTARDLDGLHTTPIRPRALLLARLCEQLATGLGIAAVLGGPPLAVYLWRHGTLEWLPWFGLVALAMAALPLVVGTGATILAVRLLPARRVRDAGGVLVSLAIAGVTAVNLLVRGPAGVSTLPSSLDPSRSGSAAASLWLPTGWAGRSWVAAARGDVLGALGWGAPLLVVGPLALVLLARLAEAAYATAYRSGQEASRGRHRRRAAGRARAGRRPAWLVVAAKDLRILSRDAAQMGQLLLPLALFAVYLASPADPGGSETRLPEWFGAALTASFAGLFAASGLALRGVGAEGARLAMLRSTPASVRSLLAGKVATGAAVSVVAGWLLLVVAAARGHVPASELPGAAARVTLTLVGLSALAVGLGSIRPRLDWTDPRRAVGLGTSLAFLAAGSMYVAVVFTALALPYASLQGSISVTAADAAAIVLVGTVAVCALAAGAARLRTMEL